MVRARVGRADACSRICSFYYRSLSLRNHQACYSSLRVAFIFFLSVLWRLLSVLLSASRMHASLFVVNSAKRRKSSWRLGRHAHAAFSRCPLHIFCAAAFFIFAHAAPRTICLAHFPIFASPVTAALNTVRISSPATRISLQPHLPARLTARCASCIVMDEGPVTE